MNSSSQPEMGAIRWTPLQSEHGPNYGSLGCGGAMAVLLGAMAASALLGAFNESGFYVVPAAGLGYLSLWVARRLYRSAQRIVEVRTGGLVIIDDGKPVELPWAAIRSLRFSAARIRVNLIPMGRQHHLWLVDTSGTEWQFDDGLKAMEKLIEAARRYSFPRILEKAQVDLHAGRSVSFGPLELSALGVVWRGRTRPWRDILGISAENGLVTILISGGKRDKVWCRVPVVSIENVDVLLHVAAGEAPVKTLKVERGSDYV